jgi:hypothetical protein
MKFMSIIAATAGMLAISGLGMVKADSYTFTPLTFASSLTYPSSTSFMFDDPNTFVIDQTAGFPIGFYDLNFGGTYTNPVSTAVNTTTYSLSGLDMGIAGFTGENSGTGSLSVQQTASGFNFDLVSADTVGDAFTFSGQVDQSGSFLAGVGTWTPAAAPESSSIIGFGALLLAGAGALLASRRKQSSSAA